MHAKNIKDHDEWVMFSCLFAHHNHASGKDSTASAGIHITAGGTSNYNCFAAETRVLTYDGVRSISELAGGTHKIITGGRWVAVPFHSYGVQQLYKLTLTRNGVTKELFTTKNHDWYLKDRARTVKTIDLKKGTYLVSSHAAAQQGLVMSLEGVRNGFVFGDGTTVTTPKGDSFSRACFCGDKIDFMLSYFDTGKYVYSYDYDGAAKGYSGKKVLIDRLPLEWKSLPTLDHDDNYLYGFLAGLLASDGCVDAKGSVSVSSSKRECLLWVRDIATRLGLLTSSISGQSRLGYGKEESMIYQLHFFRGSFPSELLLNPKHRHRFVSTPPKYDYARWSVVSVEPTNRVEEVFCCTVPETHTFTLEDNILTGNCLACGMSGEVTRMLLELHALNKKSGIPSPHIATALEYMDEEDIFVYDEDEYSDHDAKDKKYTFYEFPKHWLAGFAKATISPEAMAYLKGRNVPDKVIEDLDLRFDYARKGVGFPYYHQDGRLAGMRARLIDSTSDKKHHDYLYNSENNTHVTWFRESTLDTTKPIVVVEGQFDCARVYQAYRNVTAILMAYPTEAKLEKLMQFPSIIWFSDNDKAGIKSAKDAFDYYYSKHGIKIDVVQYQEGDLKDPDSLDPKMLKYYLSEYVDMDDLILDTVAGDCQYSVVP